MTSQEQWKLVITGCGTSHGSPPWGWREVWSEDPRDFRRRSGAILYGPHGQRILIDTGPDLMYQLRDPYKNWDGNSYPEDCITRCDGVLITHTHADHTHGINELRHLNRLMRTHGKKKSITLYGYDKDLAELRTQFAYCFADPDKAYTLGAPVLATQALAEAVPIDIAGLPVCSFAASHGAAGRVSIFRFGKSCGYLTDIKSLPIAVDTHLQHLDVLFINMLREAEHPTHACWAETEAIIKRLQPKQTVLIHMGHEVRYAEWEKRLPDNVQLACDGMGLSFLV